ncbi:hypothetical protein [Saccharothrix australiensis]|uniref:Uncharacterized protein n=1 Tax=Saccharothrix australiensis TaxID=2072 RepID=A0A495VJ37_9PSEU|nr:hypothetical protein [Saccharothrix australiensis]RKT49294.1 hypothetical protein C8E97_6790 [Saccharothrix australiensis]
MYSGPFLARAARLVLDVRQGQHARLAVLVDVGRHNPELLLDLVVEVAGLVGDDVIGRLVADDAADTRPGTLAQLVHREAHRLHWAGHRDPWVCTGERRYQAARARRRRTA